MSLELLSRLHFDQSFNRTFSPLSGSWKKFRFWSNMDQDSELAEKAFNGNFLELPKRSSPKSKKLSKKPAESSKINKKPKIYSIK